MARLRDIVVDCGLDLDSDDVDLDVQRLRSLGATVAQEQPNDSLVVLDDPEGNEFCMLR